jgi:serine/threonine protein kinase
MSPEVAYKRPYTGNIDIWALGILLYEMTHGHSVFRAKTLQEVTSNLKKIDKLEFVNGLSNELMDLIQGILRLEANERFDLQQIFEHDWIKRRDSKSSGRTKFPSNRHKETEEKEEKSKTNEDDRKKTKSWWNLFLDLNTNDENKGAKKAIKEKLKKNEEDNMNKKEIKYTNNREDSNKKEEDYPKPKNENNGFKSVSKILKEHNKTENVNEEERSFALPFSKAPQRRPLFSDIINKTNKENFENNESKGNWNNGKLEVDDRRSRSKIFQRGLEPNGDLIRRMESLKTIY